MVRWSDVISHSFLPFPAPSPPWDCWEGGAESKVELVGPVICKFFIVFGCPTCRIGTSGRKRKGNFG